MDDLNGKKWQAFSGRYNDIHNQLISIGKANGNCSIYTKLDEKFLKIYHDTCFALELSHKLNEEECAVCLPAKIIIEFCHHTIINDCCKLKREINSLSSYNSLIEKAFSNFQDHGNSILIKSLNVFLSEIEEIVKFFEEICKPDYRLGLERGLLT
ncbi:hypothetical protein A2999_00130 [Candidatus Wolfebacteria bacterium RIFCSPLOWO2_01_FULL_38_11]|uniref:Uncharacterized protein n=2 Tax=Candidatus Wolfeibacteriota TaxID=1752735 RepID=A0A0G0GBH1_9BACT|nr:MAG: hypothetical protein US36_C0001G0024 [Candidatus Wolfebacteria bacterium GW2011_GWC1_37_10]OGM90360.1 MAG: hypothetical protein A2999_00130 [Candidatus Wolfebacteria bacterium RIFCSPLOWO2_01_FULL_38_11]